MPVRESAIEQFFRKEVERAGGFAYKFVSPGNKGVPDRLVFLYGAVYLVELKAKKGVLSEIQKRQRERFAKLGFEVHVLKSKEQAATWVALQASLSNLYAERDGVKPKLDINQVKELFT